MNVHLVVVAADKRAGTASYVEGVYETREDALIVRQRLMDGGLSPFDVSVQAHTVKQAAAQQPA